MARQPWAHPVSNQEAWARAGGRRRRLASLRLRQELRRFQVVRLLRAGRSQVEIAEALHVHKSTICRDIAALLGAGVVVRSYLC